jgi:hypothetical protein
LRALGAFIAAIFLGATLLFLSEPMLAKMVLPFLGGTPSVWNTSMVFYQTLLLAGYLYAFASTKWLGRKTQVCIHLGLLVLCAAALPPHIPAGWTPPAQGAPVWWLLAVLARAIGVPFFVLASSTPVLQRWFAGSSHRTANDPYFLYAASNSGSLAGLLAYPFAVEPALRLSVQSVSWSWAYVLFGVMAVISAVIVWNAKADNPPNRISGAEEKSEFVTPGRGLRWVALAFVPSSLMLGVTTALTTDVPATPLLWVLPLAIYLVSFIFVFARRQLISQAALARRLPFVLLLGILPTISRMNLPFWVLLPLYLTTLFFVAMACHGTLAQDRPGAQHLEEFYLWIAFGGMLGGIFNSLVAPVVFSSVTELPVVLIFAAFLRQRAVRSDATSESAFAGARRNDWLLPVLLGIITFAVIEYVAHLVRHHGHAVADAAYILIFGYSALWCLSFGKRPLRFALGLAALALASSFYQGPYGRLLKQERDFFGILRVADDPAGQYRILFHGATIHGIQSLDPGRSREPLAYYTQSGPAGSIMRELRIAKAKNAPSQPGDVNWAVIGLGAGSMACYAEPGDSLTFYEIDPAVDRIAANPQYFTFLSQCAPAAQVVLGDARLRLRDAPDSRYDLIILDAFSGDTIPMHLLTREAVALYKQKLAPGGLLAFHISNLHLRLAEPVAALSQDAGLVCLVDTDTMLSHAEADRGKRASQWAVMARSRNDLGELAGDPHWHETRGNGKYPVWTDDYSSLLHFIKWSEH